MSRYIDADEFYASQVSRCQGEPVIGTCTSDNALLYGELQKMSTSDVVEVIRCKDCENCLSINARYMCKIVRCYRRAFLQLRRKER